MGDRHLHSPERQIRRAAVVHADRIFHALLGQPQRNLVIANRRRPGALGDFYRVGNMIAVPVRDENEIGLGGVGFDRRRRRVVQKRIDQQRVFPGRDRPAGMSQPGEFGHRVQGSGFSVMPAIVSPESACGLRQLAAKPSPPSKTSAPTAPAITRPLAPTARPPLAIRPRIGHRALVSRHRLLIPASCGQFVSSCCRRRHLAL